MKKLFLLAIGLGFALTASAQMKFEEGTWAEVKAKAQKENKIIFVDAYTTWCGPCKWMSANTFKDATVGEYYNANFVNYKFDMEKGEGVQFANDYRIEAYPTLLFVKADGSEAHRTEGSMSAPDFVALGKTVMGGGSTPEPEPEKPHSDDWESLNSMAWEAYEQETAKDKLQEALGWAKQSMDIQKNSYNTDTYAHLLYKLGNKKDALVYANEALKLGKEAGVDYAITEKLIQKIKTGK